MSESSYIGKIQPTSTSLEHMPDFDLGSLPVGHPGVVACKLILFNLWCHQWWVWTLVHTKLIVMNGSEIAWILEITSYICRSLKCAISAVHWIVKITTVQYLLCNIRCAIDDLQLMTNMLGKLQVQYKDKVSTANIDSHIFAFLLMFSKESLCLRFCWSLTYLPFTKVQFNFY